MISGQGTVLAECPKYRIQRNLVVLAEDSEVEQGLLRRQEPQVPGGEALERGALAVVPVLRRHHRRSELLGEHLSIQSCGTQAQSFSTCRVCVCGSGSGSVRECAMRLTAR